MFDKLKKLKELKNMKDQMSKEEAVVEDDGIKVTIGGDMTVKSIEAEGDVDPDKVKDLVNQGMKKIQKQVASLFK